MAGWDQPMLPGMDELVPEEPECPCWPDCLELRTGTE